MVSDYIFTSQRESYSVPEVVIFLYLQFFCSILELTTIDLPKLTSSILMEIVARCADR